MGLFIFGILLLAAGIIGGILLSNVSEEKHRRDEHFNSIKDENGNYIYDTVYPLRKFSLLSYAVGIGLGIACIVSSVTESVPTGYTGISTVFGRVEDRTMDAGFHLKAPWVSIIEMDNRVQMQKS